MNRYRHQVRFSNRPPTTIPAPQVEPDLTFLKKIEDMPYPESKQIADYSMDLFTASSLGYTDMLHHLTRQQFGEKNTESWTSLLYGAYLGHENVCSDVLCVNPSILNCRDSYGRSAIMLAAACGNVSLVKRFLTLGGKVNYSDINERTALHYAVINKQHSIVELLLEWKADPNRVDVEQMTPTAIAASLEYARIFEALLENGANPLVANNEGQSAESFVLESQNPRLTAILDTWRLEHRTAQEIQDLGTLLRIFRMDGYLPMLERKGIDINRFLTLTKKDIDAVIGDPSACRELYTIVEYFTPYGVDPKRGSSAQLDYVHYFTEHVKHIEQTAKMALAAKESHRDRLAMYRSL
ncbi:hypothetical protein QR680_013070 [Steinernema hermaphroditum]|uniref:SAM domain-containing protein n=1 Tax=Steinernema hermaphroditum TaxID=289476 RepID=A0AA39M0Z2_9BILA|nr:hypothetical protein QR680_013070 [Steinernema hermaphroditum]